MTIEEMRALLDELNTQVIEIQAKADVEKRDLTDEESESLQGKLDEFDKMEDSLKLRIKIEEQTKRMKNLGEDPDDPPSQRRTSPDVPGGKAGDNGNGPTRRGTVRVRERIQDDPKRGWRLFGDFAKAVRSAHSRGGVDERLTRAATTYGSEGVGADGGFAVPPGMSDTILAELEDEDSLLARASTDQISTNSMTYPKDEATPWGTTGIISEWEGEGGTHTERKPSLKTTTISANKLVSLVKVTEELLEDARALDSYLSRKAASAIRFKTDLALNQGDGVGKPLGFRDAGGTIAVARNATNVNATDVRNMWVRLYGPWRKNSVWLANQDVETHLMQMYGIDQESTPLATWPVYLPAGGFSAQPFSTLFGRPVIFTQTCDAVTNKGDICLVDMTQYRAVAKGGLRSESSIHLHFDQDITSFKFVMRIGGQPMWESAISPRSGAVTASGFIVLAA